MAKKGSSKHSRNKSTSNSNAQASKAGSNTSSRTTSSAATAAPAPPTNGSTPTRGSNSATPTSTSFPLKFRLLFVLFPLLQMLWQIEAPLRPFSALRDRSTGEVLRRPSQEEGKEGELMLFEPRILVVVPHVRDLPLFAPTVGIMMGKERRERSTVFVMGLLSGAEAGKKNAEWDSSLDVLGLEKERRFLLDVPGLQDTPDGAWDPNVVSDTVLQYVLENTIDTILTVDEQGITGDPQNIAVSKGITSLIHSPRLTDALSSSPDRIHPRVFLLRTPFPLFNLGPLSPIIQHFILAYRALRGYNSGSGTKSMRTTTFVNDVRHYYKAWKALVMISDAVDPVSLVRWVVGRSLWVNEWVEV